MQHAIQTLLCRNSAGNTLQLVHAHGVPDTHAWIATSAVAAKQLKQAHS